MEGLITILLFVGVIAVTAVIFVVWLVVAIIRGIFRLLVSLARPIRLPPLPGVRSSSGQRVCPNDRCRAPQPSHARFCRRCGRELPGIRRVHVRRAAMW